MIIRKATPSDAPAIAACLLLAMEEILYTFVGAKNSQEAAAFMAFFVAQVDNQYSYANCWVAELNGVVAAVNIYDGAALHQLRAPVVEYIKSRYNKQFSPEDETGPDEWYIDTIGVRPEQQGKGIGTALLQFLIDKYVVKNGHTLGLLVDENNPNAKRMYVRLGFKSVGCKNLFGKRLEHLQVGT